MVSLAAAALLLILARCCDSFTAKPTNSRKTALGAAYEDLVWCSKMGVSLATGEALEKRATFAYSGEEHEYAYIALGDPAAPPVLLVHGFGASSFHWRGNVAALAETNRVYAVDLLGFGASSKPLIDYSGSRVWIEQCEALLRDVVCAGVADGGKKAVVAGNSIGGFVALSLAGACPDLVSGVASLNGAGKFASSSAEVEVVKKEVNPLVKSASAFVQRLVIGAAFVATKQPARIGQVLRQVYPVDPGRCDDQLIASIEFPAREKTAAEVFYRIVKRNDDDDQVTIDTLLAQLQCPLLLLWGEKDPWIRPATADRIAALCVGLDVVCTRVSIDAGHCPHDEAPRDVNAALLGFMNALN